MPPKKTTKKPTKKSAGKKSAGKRAAKKPAKKTTRRKTPKKSDPKKIIKEIQEGKKMALDQSSVVKLFRAALTSIGMGSMSLEGAVKEELVRMAQQRGSEMASRAYMIDKHKRNTAKTISGDAIELAYTVCGGDVGIDARAFVEADSTPSLKKGQLMRLIKASVPVHEDGDYMSVSADAKKQLDVILTIYIYNLAKNAVQYATSENRRRISAADLAETARVTA
jgi:histone H3/H4